MKTTAPGRGQPQNANDKIRIAVVSTMGYASGGSESLWTEMAVRALDRGHTIGAFAPRWPSVPGHLAMLKDRGAELFLRRRPVGRASRWLSRIEKPFKSVFDFRPDVVLLNQGASFDIVQDRPVARLVSDLAGPRPIPYVVLCHANSEDHIPTTQERHDLRRFFSSASRVGAVSQRLIDTIRRQLAAPVGNATILRNPVNLRHFSAIPFPPSEPARFACVGSLHANKGWDVLFESLSAPDWRNRDWRLTVAGEGELLGYLRDLAAHLGISDRVEFAGFVTDIRELWSRHHVLAFASRHEGGPMVVVEAMLCGRPVVSTDVGLVRQWVRDGETGFIAELPTVWSFSRALQRAWDDRVSWPEIGRRAHAAAAGQIDPDPGATLLKILEEAASGRERAGQTE